MNNLNETYCSYDYINMLAMFQLQIYHGYCEIFVKLYFLFHSLHTLYYYTIFYEKKTFFKVTSKVNFLLLKYVDKNLA